MTADACGRMESPYRFLSPEWLDEVETCVAGHSTEVLGGRSVVFEHDDEDLGRVTHTQVWSDGVLQSWKPGRPVEWDVVVRFDLWAAYLWLFGGAVSGAEIEVVDCTGVSWSVPPTPSQLAQSASQRRVPGLSFTARVTVPDHPFGEREQTYTFEDGVVVVGGPTDAADADPLIDVSLPFDGAGMFLLGAVPFRDIASRSRVHGDVYAFGNLAALLAPPYVFREGSIRHQAMIDTTAALVGTSALRSSLRRIEPLTIVP